MADPDELARTATAVSGSDSEPAKPVGAMLGRYRIEKTLGEGGMGVVHCAFDPDLERRVALKVLRRTDGGGDARQRLLREARAMARLTHENVVVVHEVGTAGDRDYVAMELIEGQTLADWLGDKSKPATIAEIVDAFIAAAKGLAAAHAAGLVHRDFKPHNVLRRADGKIVVTDFGLARGVENVEAVALDETMDPSQPKSDSSGLGGITKTGSVLGTPAYMAPEQWSGGTVGPAADQFAFCVALWEALTGERPFSGATLEELKTSVGKGSASLDASKLPRRLRKALIRGLDPDPKKRWPSMDALIAAIRRADRHVGLAFMVAGGAIVAGAIALFAMHRGSSCEAPALDPQTVWKQDFAAAMPPAMADMYKRELGHWAIARATACTAEPMKRTIQLHCLDGVLSRFDVVRQAFTPVKEAKVDDVIDNLVDPSVCLRDVTPRLAYPHTAESIEAANLYAKIKAAKDDDARKLFKPAADAFLAKPDLDACSKTVATFAKSKTLDDFNAERAMIEDAATQSEQCDDDRIHADLLVSLIPYVAETPNIGPRGIEAMKRAAASVERVKQPNLTARLDLYRVRAMYEAGKQKESLALIDQVATAFQSSGQTYLAAMAVIGSFGIRMRLDKMSEVEQLIAHWRPVVQSVGTEDDVRKIDRWAALLRYTKGEVEAGHADLVRLWKQHKDRVPPHPLHGTVVDRDGKPVAGAQVVTAAVLNTDTIGILLPYIGGDDDDENYLRVATTNAAGEFSFTDAPEVGVIEAQMGAYRSVAERTLDGQKLVLKPTRRLAGKVDIGKVDATDVIISLHDPTDHTSRALMITPIKPDGTFALDGVPQTKISLSVNVQTPAGLRFATPIEIAPGTEPVSNLDLTVPASSARKVWVLGRSSFSVPLEGAQVVLVPGKISVLTIGQLQALDQKSMMVRFARHVTGESVPQEAAASYKPGDLIAEFSDVPDGTFSACVIPLPADIGNDKALYDKIMKHREEIDVRCDVLGPDDNAIAITAPPPKNFD